MYNYSLYNKIRSDLCRAEDGRRIAFTDAQSAKQDVEWSMRVTYTEDMCITRALPPHFCGAYIDEYVCGQKWRSEFRANKTVRRCCGCHNDIHGVGGEYTLRCGEGEEN